MKRALDLYCGAGGASMGLHRAGFEVVGVDLSPQPRYPFAFIRADVLGLTPEFVRGFDFVWASPMCQAHTWSTRRGREEKFPAQIAPTRELLKAAGVEYVIENVVGAGPELVDPVRLCGFMFGLKVIRHRLFECSFPVDVPAHRPCSGAIARGDAYTVCGHGGDSKSFKLADWQAAMGIDWMAKAELTQSIPPAYSEYLARQALHGATPRAGEGAPVDRAPARASCDAVASPA